MYPIIDPIKTGQKIKELMLKNNLCPKDLQIYLSLACVQSIYRWINGKTVPGIDHLYALSVLFQTPIDDIVQGNRQPLTSSTMFIKENHTSYLYN
jgi:hypothetical protein